MFKNEMIKSAERQTQFYIFSLKLTISGKLIASFYCYSSFRTSVFDTSFDPFLGRIEKEGDFRGLLSWVVIGRAWNVLLLQGWDVSLGWIF